MKIKSYGKIAVLMGGTSSERDVSIMSGTEVLKALVSCGLDAHAFDPAQQAPWDLKTQGFARVFNVLHGEEGEDGRIQAVLELLGLPYTGSGVLASALAMDKWRSKLIWKSAGLSVADFVVLNDHNTDFTAAGERLGFPLFVKPNLEGSSMGVSKVKSLADFKAAYEEARRYNQDVMAERFIDGGEYTCAVIAGQTYPTIKIEPANEFYDYEAKYFRDDTLYHCPSGLDSQQEAAAQALCLQAFNTLGCTGWGRVDFLTDLQGNLYLLEINTNPGMTTHSLVPIAAKARGMDFIQTCLAILDTTYVE